MATSTSPAPEVVALPGGPNRGRARRRQVRRRQVAVTFGRLLLVGVLLGIWQLAASRGWINRTFFGSPTSVADELGRLLTGDARILRGRSITVDVLATVKATLLGFSIGSSLGLVAGFVLGSSPTLDRLVAPLLAFANSLPRIALAPIFILWFGLSMWSKVALAVSIVALLVLINVRSAVMSVSPDHLLLARMLDVKPWTRLLRVVLPNAAAAIMGSLRLGVTYTLLGVSAMEMIAARDGLGRLAVAYSDILNVNGVFAVLMMIGALAMVFDLLLGVIERYVLRWNA